MQFEWIINLFTAGGLITVLILFIVIYFVIAGALLGIALGFVNGRNRGIGSTAVTALLCALVSPLPCIGCILSLYFIKTRHETGWGGAIIAYILTIIITVIIIAAIMLLIFPGTWALIYNLLPI